MSIGFVGNQSAWKGRSGTPEKELFASRIASSPNSVRANHGAEIASDVYSTANYSYRARQGNGDGFLMIGDAYGFVDPMFSDRRADGDDGRRIGREDRRYLDPESGARQKMAARTNSELAKAMDRISWLIYRVNDPVMRTMFMAPSNRFLDARRHCQHAGGQFCAAICARLSRSSVSRWRSTSCRRCTSAGLGGDLPEMLAGDVARLTEDRT